MIAGIGVDVVDVQRFERAVSRTPRLLTRLFAQGEQGLPVRSLAARFAAKEALVKALGGDAGLGWPDLEVVSDPEGRPAFVSRGRLAGVLAARGVRRAHLSLTHDAGIACAFVVLDGSAS
ncbi:MAG TPA: holo-ACP synthase [Microbacteriaceae bacterium]|nr:holo-ACP synthase [Microbacteriaceae bacterium]